MLNPIFNIKDKLETIIKDSFLSLFPDLRDEMEIIEIEIPKDKSHGDFSTNFAFKMAKKLSKNPREIALELSENISKFDFIKEVSIAGPGFINFKLELNYLYDTISYILNNKDTYGMVDYGKNKKVMVEFISANPTGPMHIGNARGGALGDCLSNVLCYAGFDCQKEFYVNDYGNQIEKLKNSLNIRFLQLVNGENSIEMPEDAYHGSDIIEHVENYVNEYGKDDLLALEEEERKEKLKDYALNKNINKLKADTKRYGIEYDKWFYESELHNANKVLEVIDELKEKGYTYDKDDATWFKATEFGSEKDVVLIRGNNIPTYFAADIAYHKNKVERGYELLINIWGADHHGHVARMKGALQALGYNPDCLNIILMQLVRLYKDGEIYRVSKRSGKSLTLSDLLDETGTDAARFFFNLRQANTHFDFDLDLAVSKSNENPVFYVQYAHARIASIVNMLSDEGINVNIENTELLNKLVEQEEIELMKKIAYFPQEITDAAITFDPSKITKYAVELAGSFHSFYNACRVKTDDKDIMNARLMLVLACKHTIFNSLNVLGITAPERM